MPFTRSTVDAVTQQVAAASEAAGIPTAVPVTDVLVWVEQIHSQDAATRAQALTRLLEHPDALTSLAPSLLREDAPSVRTMTLTALASTTHPALESWLVHVLDTDHDVNVCAAAVELLGEVGTGAARASLEALPTRFPTQPFIRFAVRVALERLSDG